MENTEIFLNKMAAEKDVYAELSEKLSADISDCVQLAEVLMKADGTVDLSLYVSTDDTESAAVSAVLRTFEECAAGNKALRYTVTEDEFLTIIDEEGHLTEKAKPRILIHRDGDLHLAVHVWIVKRRDMGIYILLQKRSKDKRIHPECYDVSAAGHVAQGEEFRTTAVRETMEELGLKIHGSKLEFLKHHRCSYVKGDIRDNEIRAIYICREELDTDKLNLQKSEVSDTCWVELDELLAVMDDISFDHCLDPKELALLKKAVF